MKKFLPLIALGLALSAPLAQAADSAPAAGAAKPATSVAAAYAADTRYTYKTKRLTREEFDKAFAKSGKILVLDVRRPDELTKLGGFPAYLSIQSDDVEKELAYIPKDRKIITVSNRAHRAGAIGDLLTSKGFQVCGAVGVLDYAEQGGNLTKIAPPPPKPETPAAAEPAKP